MGSRRLPGCILGGLILASACAAGCGSSPKPTPTPTAPAATPTATASPRPTSTPTASPTPDPLNATPRTADDAVSGVTAELIAAPTEPCPAALTDRWHVRCATGDFDGDGEPDTAFLVPLEPAAGAKEAPAAVLVLRSATKELEPLPGIDDTADASATGVAFFAAHTVPGEGDALAFMTAACTASGCLSQVHLEHWDGTAWRDLGPGDAGVSALESATWDDDGQLVVKGGKFTAPGAGPTRDVTITYAYDGSRYAESSRVYAPPVYLFHAITDADAKFAAADWDGAITAYNAAISDTSLKDWKDEQGDPPGRPALVSYALFRIAIATAAEGNDPSVALDRVIVQAQDPIFAYAAQQFRQGWQQTGSVHGGCAAATTYLGTSDASGDNPAYIKQAFNYGYANQPVKTYLDICPL